jgi:hypothetical protein
VVSGAPRLFFFDLGAPLCLNIGISPSAARVVRRHHGLRERRGEAVEFSARLARWPVAGQFSGIDFRRVEAEPAHLAGKLGRLVVVAILVWRIPESGGLPVWVKIRPQAPKSDFRSIPKTGRI